MTEFMTNQFTVFFKHSAGFGKYIARHCAKIGGRYDKTVRAMINVPGIYTVYIGDWKDYVRSYENGKYMLNKGDLIVFSEVNDPAPSTPDEFDELIDKYDDGYSAMVVSNVSHNILFDNSNKPWGINHIEANNE